MFIRVLKIYLLCKKKARPGKGQQIEQSMTESENLAARVFWLMGLIPNMTSDAAADACGATATGNAAYRGRRDRPSLDPLTQNPTAVPRTASSTVARWAALMRCSITKGHLPFLPLLYTLPSSMLQRLAGKCACSAKQAPGRIFAQPRSLF